MNKQIASTVLMIEPVAFGFNAETAKNNYFQINDNSNASLVQENALKEFGNMVTKLRLAGIEVIVVKDTLEPTTPDSIFPNNWISIHENGNIVLYPMYAKNRSAERRKDIVELLSKKFTEIPRIVDYSAFEDRKCYLEGTGSMILDRQNKIAYAAISERTDKQLFIQFCNDFEFKPVYFTANQDVNQKRLPIYHTNVMLCVADKYAVICLSSIDDLKERKEVEKTLIASGKEIIEINENQMHDFAGNMLQLENGDGKP